MIANDQYPLFSPAYFNSYEAIYSGNNSCEQVVLAMIEENFDRLMPFFTDYSIKNCKSIYKATKESLNGL